MRFLFQEYFIFSVYLVTANNLEEYFRIKYIPVSLGFYKHLRCRNILLNFDSVHCQPNFAVCTESLGSFSYLNIDNGNKCAVIKVVPHDH